MCLGRASLYFSGGASFMLLCALVAAFVIKSSAKVIIFLNFANSLTKILIDEIC